MREIKFRAWIDAEKRMIGWRDLLIEKDDEDGFFLWVKDDPNNYHSGATSERDFVLIQYTGLKDKNGMEIYEGDIVEVIHEDGFKTIGQVVWGLDSHRYGSYPAFAIPEFESDLNSFAEIYDSGYYEIEVIGNIYENPELLEEKQ